MKKLIITILFSILLISGCGKEDVAETESNTTAEVSSEEDSMPDDWVEEVLTDEDDFSEATNATEEEPDWKKPVFTEEELASWDDLEDMEDPEDELWDVYEAERIKAEQEEKHGYEIINLLDAHFISFEQYPGLYNLLRGSFIDLKPSYIEIVPESIEGDYSQGKCQIIPEGYDGKRGEIWLYGKDGGLNISWVHTSN